MTGIKQIGRAAALCLSIGLIAGCSATFRNHGFVPRAADVATIVVGTDTREDVAAKIGGPATDSLRTVNAWHYVESRFRTRAGMQAEEIEREVLRVKFDSHGRVSNIERFGLEDGQVVRLSARVTETVDTDIGFLRAILGNFGSSDPAALLP